MGITDHLTCLLRSLYANQETTIGTGHGITDWFKTGKGVHKGCILSLCLFNLYAEYIMRNTGRDETQTRIKTAGRNINNLRYADNTPLVAESKEEIKSLLGRVKDESKKDGLKLSFQKSKVIALSHYSMATRRGKSRKWQILFSWAPKSLQIVTTTMKLKDPCFKSMINLDSILKGRDITLPTKVHIVKAVVFQVVVYNARVRLTRKKADCQRIDAFKLWCWRRPMRFLWTAGKSNQLIINEINP